MNKLEMAHDFAMKLVGNPTTPLKTMESIVDVSWKYADAMQAEADKRKPIPKLPALQQTFIDGVEQPRYAPSCDEWQPDWSQAPDEANYWAMDKDSSANFFRNKPEITNGNGWDFGGVMQSNNAHKYTGNWQDSLRKRPQ